MYLQHHGSQQQNTDKAKNIIFYALWVLYALSAITSSVSIVLGCPWSSANIEMVHHLGIIKVTAFACCDFITQFILIYRCWIIWGCSIRVAIFPSLLAFVFLAIWIASGTAPLSIVQDQIVVPVWSNILPLTGLTLSMTVNALVTGLIVFRIFKVFQEVKTCCTADDQISGVTGESTLQRVIFILIESGMALFSIQLARLVVTIMRTDGAYAAYCFIGSIHEILNGITPTIILVRVSMGLSFHDESSLVEASIGSLRFAHDISNPIPENGVVDEESRRHDDLEIQLSDDSDIEMVDR